MRDSEYAFKFRTSPRSTLPQRFIFVSVHSTHAADTEPAAHRRECRACRRRCVLNSSLKLPNILLPDPNLRTTATTRNKLDSRIYALLRFCRNLRGMCFIPTEPRAGEYADHQEQVTTLGRCLQRCSPVAVLHQQILHLLHMQSFEFETALTETASKGFADYNYAES